MFRRIVQVILKPYMRFRLFLTEPARRAIPRPSGRGDVHTTGTNPDRILLMGSGAAMGYGVLSQDLSFAGHLARQLTTVTGRATDIDIIAAPDMTAVSALNDIADVDLSRFDAVITLLGINEAGTLGSIRRWRRSIDAFIAHIRAEGPASLRIILVEVPATGSLGMIPKSVAWLGDRHARLLNRVLRHAARANAGVAFVQFRPVAIPDTVLYRSSESYRTWAGLIVPSIAAELEPSGSSPRPFMPQDELARQKALDELGILDTPPEGRFDRITARARDSFKCEAAAITFLDHDRQWFKSSLGLGPTEFPRANTFTDFAIRRPGLFTVEDARNDPRFWDAPLVAGEPYIRFYAGYPIEAPGGERVGALFVIDTATRVFSQTDAGLLRDLALKVQEELWSAPDDSDA